MSSDRSRGSAGLTREQRELFERLLTSEGLASGTGRDEIHRRSRDDDLPLSFSQQRLWFLAQLEPAGAAYNMPLAVRLRGALDRPILAKCLAEIVRRHEALRTSFDGSDGMPVQRVHPSVPLPLPLVDLRGLPPERRRPESRRAALSSTGRPFALDRAPLLRAMLVDLGGGEHLAVLTLHHIVGDGWSLGVLVRELGALYEAFGAGRPSPLPPLPVQYPDYAAWQRERLRGDRMERLLEVWRRRLEGAPSGVDLPVDRPRPSVRSSRGGRVPVRFPTDLSERLEAVAGVHGVPLFVAVLSAWVLLLHRRSGQDGLTVGSPVANRDRDDLEATIGFFVNTLVLRADLSGRPGFDALLDRLGVVTREAVEHQELPFEELVQELSYERDLGRSPLFQVMLAFDHEPTLRLSLGDLKADPEDVAPPVSKFDLSLYLERAPDGLAGCLEFDRDLFDRTTVEHLGRQLLTLARAAVEHPERPVDTLASMARSERHQVLVEWRGAVAEEIAASCPSELFADRARSDPDAPALRIGGTVARYGELADRVDAVAGRLRREGAGPEVPVGVFLPRSADLVTALMAVLRAGGTYVPLDPGYPDARLRTIAEDAAASAGGTLLVVTNGELAERLGAARGARLLEIDREGDGEAGGAADGRWPLAFGGADPETLSHVIYTSGSTGAPKGVGVRRRSVLQLIAWARRVFPADVLAEVVAATSVAFDLSVFEIVVTLAAGGTVRLVEDGLAAGEPGALHGASLVNTVPSVLAGALGARALPSTVRWVDLAGEVLPRDLVDRLYRQPTVERVLNLYGPSEDTTYTTWASVPRGSGAPPSIGRPIDGTRVHLLDPRGAPVAIGEVAELCVGGDGLARGYLGAPALTAARFVPDPFGSAAGGRLYRTGDLGRHRPDGEIDFLGRIDRQVKVRGVRIEPTEVEACLREIDGVEEAVVVLPEGDVGELVLTAFVVPTDPGADGRRLERAALEHLRRSLPAAMVPARLTAIDELPRLPNGKVDRSALPPWEPPVAEATVETPPETPVERRLIAVWRELLGVERIGVDDSFFDLGGHSLLVARLRHRLREELGAELSMVDLFRNPTVRSLAAAIEEGGGRASGTPRERMAAAGAERWPDGVAIVGMAGRFPGAASIHDFWRNLVDGIESITRLDAEALASAGADRALVRDPRFVPASAGLDEASRFDAAFFGFSPREAEIMDPQHRLFLECAWQALEEAGYGTEDGRGVVGVFAGTSLSSHLSILASDPATVRSVGLLAALIANDKDYLATRVAHKLDLTGPAVAVQSACSTSLVAVHLACRALLGGECELALAGGASLAALSEHGYLYEEGGILSPDGRCRAFDAEGGGTVKGEGVGVVALKRLGAAVRDGDAIHAVIRGSAVNNDGGRRIGFTAPGLEGQAAVIAAAQAAAGVGPESIGYVEAHGTGTSVGDPIEIAALTAAFRAGTERNGTCAVGSVKTNIGHLDAAAGVAGLVKTALAVRHGVVPPSLHFRRPNPRIDFPASPFYVNDRRRAWRAESGPRRAGVSAFGIGGTNAHVVVEEPPLPRPSGPPARPAHLLILSARNERALAARAEDLERFLLDRPEVPLADVEHTLQAGRRRFEHRRYVVCRNREEALALLSAERLPGRLDEASDRPVVFVLSGQGTQHPGMGAELYRNEVVFRREIDRCADLLGAHRRRDLRSLLFAGDGEPEAAESLRRTAWAQPALFALELALARLWESWGVRPQGMLGHSVGEYVAASLAGVFSVEDGLTLVAERGRLMDDLPGGSMLAVPLPAAEVEELLGDDLSLAASNAPDLCVVSGPGGAVARLAETLRERDLACRPLRTSHAFHSAMMDPALPELAARVAGVERHAPRVPFVSNLTGGWIGAREATDPEYWARHARSAVRFDEGLATLVGDRDPIVLEIGPGDTLCRLARRRGRETVALPSLPGPRGRRPETEHLLDSVGRAWVAGATIDWRGFHGGSARNRVHLPTYRFQGERFVLAARGDPARPAERARADGDWTWIPRWQQAPPSAMLSERRPVERCLLFVGHPEAEAPARALADELRGRGARVVTASRGEGARGPGGHELRLDPESSDEWAALFDELAGREDAPSHVVVFGAPGAEGSDDGDFFSVLALCRALAVRRDGRGAEDGVVDLAVVVGRLVDVTGGEPVAPERALALGPVMVAPLEVPGLRCRAVDPGDGADARSLADEIELPADDLLVAHRNGRRWIRTFEPVSLPAPEGTPARLRSGGVYVVTGGLGGLGSTLARHLAKSVGARLVLIGRSTGAGDALAAELRELGGEVLVAGADVADREAMAGVAARARERFGGVDGVFHVAGVAGGGLIRLKERQAAEAVLRPKVAGTRVLAEVFGEDDLDFLVLFSSLNALHGSVGQVDYCAANAFLDSFAHARNRTSAPPVLSIDWDAWRDVGMAAAAADRFGTDAERWLATALEPAEGMGVLDRLLDRFGTQVAVATRDLPSILAAAARPASGPAELEPAARGTAEGLHSRPALDTPFVAPREPVEEELAAIWRELLGLDPIGVHDSFYDLGGHSLLATRLISRAEEALGVSFSLEEILSRPTVAEMAEGVAARRAGELGADELDALAEEIRSLSPEELRRDLGVSEARIPEERG